ncbi:MAG TPA: hypothetical protein VFC74_03090 [Oscillospiraceae bacterium]|nr:hypothetical protein [Oscillospiraceae bacterium]
MASKPAIPGNKRKLLSNLNNLLSVLYYSACFYSLVNMTFLLLLFTVKAGYVKLTLQTYVRFGGKKMSHARFPSTHLILPEFRQVALKPTVIPEVIQREKNKQEFQRLLDISLRSKVVLHIISTNEAGSLKTTGIVKTIDHNSGLLLIQTLEGPRRIQSHEVQDVLAEV